MLENDPHFNAGKGAVFNDQGEVSSDASSDGSTKMAGAVAGKAIKNPVLARAVMEETSHVLLLAKGRGLPRLHRGCGQRILFNTEAQTAVQR